LDLGSKPPALSLALADGSRFNVSDSAQVVVLNFWAGYCEPCREEAPILSAFQAQTADVKVVGLSIEQESPAQVASQARRLGMRYAVGVADEAVLSRFRVQSVPTTYVIAKSGKIVLSHVGPIDASQLTTALARARDAG
jgi:thiol-disulfide isomerase/thioredoxin